jgi:hypothetical protein
VITCKLTPKRYSRSNVNTASVIHIVPRRTDQPDGVGDYATILAQVMYERNRCVSTFLPGTPAQTEAPIQDSWRTVPVIRRRGCALASQLSCLCRETDAKAVILHVSGYGYQRRGAPIWLLTGLRAWRRMHPHVRMIGIFHELFASGHFWNSSFWLSAAQKYVTQELWRLCDGGLATNHAYFEQLAAWRPTMRQQLKAMPVFSNVGEPDAVPAAGERPNYMAVFGRPGVEQWIYNDPHASRSADVVRKLGIEKIIDIGSRVSALPGRLGNTPIIALGRLPRAAVSEYLLGCRFGLLNYGVMRLGKSGVFAAYAAHGVIPVCIQDQSEQNDQLHKGRHFLQWPLQKLPLDLSCIQTLLKKWYQDHSTQAQADLLSAWCLEPKSIAN